MLVCWIFHKKYSTFASLKMTMVRQAVPLQPMEVHGGADIHLQPVEDPTPEQVDAQRRL